MKLVTYNGGHLGVVTARGVVDVTDLAGVPADFWPPIGMSRLIAQFPRLAPEIRRRSIEAAAVPLDSVRLGPPQPRPGNLIAYPANFEAHRDEMRSPYRASSRGFFLKATSSICGPADDIELPDIPLREIHHECEFGIVIGRGGRGIGRAEAMSHVFGYCCLIDMTVRGDEERVMRKSYDTFTPIGPWLVTADEVPDPHAMALRLSVNGQVRQQANTRDLILDIPGMIEMASSVMTLQPGDLIASGTPAGVGPLRAGDTVSIEVEGLGAMALAVRQSTHGMNAAFEHGNRSKSPTA
ncbi:MAG: fumarylacetoacetate hydrolase family protein [Pigmentiphaga sp.]|uniref:fumarylacetoacetate hydrolase family protein n=1 Tax=Pigmentiphaga sp. TaxID=1977564 RepID=UPI0029B50316|nr:fumarylacetoacetate hydrolase family protein [Pigmentiphaga sp.]MDX3906327.1 fumarylacetoacetate hydrolase family protein [Pigmentiphaga sp.]